MNDYYYLPVCLFVVYLLILIFCIILNMFCYGSNLNFIVGIPIWEVIVS